MFEIPHYTEGYLRAAGLYDNRTLDLSFAREGVPIPRGRAKMSVVPAQDGPILYAEIDETVAPGVGQVTTFTFGPEWIALLEVNTAGDGADFQLTVQLD